MLIQFTRRRSRKKLVARWCLLMVLAVLAAFVAPSALKSANSGYKDWKCERALRQAKTFFAAKEFAKANTALQVALRADRTNIEVWKTIAEMTEASGAREAILQRQQVVLLMPSDLDAKVALAMTAMRFGDMYTARDALGTVPASYRSATNYRRAVALYAILEGNGSTAEQVLASLMKSNPGDNVRFDYLSVRLSHPDPVVATSARQELAGMVESTTMALLAVRALMTDAIFRKDFPAALGWAKRLVKLPDALYSDKLAMGTLTVLIEKKPLDTVLPSLIEEAAQDPLKIADLSRWLLVQGQVSKVRELIDAQSAEVKDSSLLKPVRVDLAIARQDWPVVGELLLQGALGPVPPEALRLVMEARTVGELHGEAARFAHWGKALDLTRTNIFGLRVFYQLGVTWKWGREVEATLLAIARGFPGQTWAHEALVRVYTVEKNGPGLQQIFAIWNQQAIGVTRIRHDSTLMDLLVLGTKTPAHVKKAAEELYNNERSNPFYATTCALAYALDGRVQEALAIVSKLQPADRAVPPRAPYLAFIYAKGRKGDLVREQLALVRPEALLREEADLVTQARAMLDQIDAESREIHQLISGERESAAAQSPAPQNTKR